MRDVEQILSERYAAPPAWRRPVTIVAVVVVAVVALAWLAWAAIDQATPKVESNLLGWDVVDAHAATARIDVTIHDAGVPPDVHGAGSGQRPLDRRRADLPAHRRAPTR